MRAAPQDLDLYSYYDYKPRFRDGLAQDAYPSWVPEVDKRRLGAYMMLESFMVNNSRTWKDVTDDESDVDERREYGDPAVVVDTILSSLLGDDQRVFVEGALPNSEADQDPVAEAHLKLLEEWADKENLWIKNTHGERDSIKYGDGVYVLGWDPVKARPRLRIWDPGFYFPWLSDDGDNEFPPEIRIAYDVERPLNEDGSNIHTFLHMHIWRMVDITDLSPGDVGRRLPWHTPEQEPATQICFYWNGEIDHQDIGTGIQGSVYDMWTIPEAKVTWEVEALDMNIDFIPVIHKPNTIPGAEHFGTSSLAKVLQVLDDLVATDTDLQAAAATTGSPPIVMQGYAGDTLQSYGPGTVLSAEGGATLMDTSRSLDALIKLNEALLSRLSVNGRIPESLLGRVKPNEVPSGIALTLSFTPHSQLIKEMRMLRDVKNGLLLKFVLRMYMANGVLEASEPNKCRIIYGSFLPADRSEAATLVNQLYRNDKPMVSLETAVQILLNAGFPIDEVEKEIRRIEENDFGTAQQLLDATGDLSAVNERLGLGGLPPAPEQPPGLPQPAPLGTPPEQL